MSTDRLSEPLPLLFAFLVVDLGFFSAAGFDFALAAFFAVVFAVVFLLSVVAVFFVLDLEVDLLVDFVAMIFPV